MSYDFDSPDAPGLLMVSVNQHRSSSAGAPLHSPSAAALSALTLCVCLCVGRRRCDRDGPLRCGRNQESRLPVRAASKQPACFLIVQMRSAECSPVSATANAVSALKAMPASPSTTESTSGNGQNANDSVAASSEQLHCPFISKRHKAGLKNQKVVQTTSVGIAASLRSLVSRSGTHPIHTVLSLLIDDCNRSARSHLPCGHHATVILQTRRSFA